MGSGPPRRTTRQVNRVAATRSASAAERGRWGSKDRAPLRWRSASRLPRTTMKYLTTLSLLAGLLALPAAGQAKQDKEKLYLDPINVTIPHIATDKSVKYDFDIVYVRAPRAGDKVHKRFFTDFSSPVTLEPGADLMLLHPDSSEQLLVPGGEAGP